MQGTILTFGIVASILAIVLRPKYALVVYLTILIWFPDYLRLSIGTIDISCSRMVVTVLLIRCLSNQKLMTKFKWSQLDKIVTYSIMVYVGVTLITRPRWSLVENRAGFVMDTWFAYMIVRFIITDKEKLVSVIKFVSVVLVPLAILGCIEAITDWQPFVPLSALSPWIIGEIVKQYRWGFTRAIGPFEHAILFGNCFIIFLPLVYYLRNEKNIWRFLAYLFSGIILLGAISSFSMGPLVMMVVALFCLTMEKFKLWVKPMIKFLIFSLIFIQLFSNRSFYHVLFSYVGTIGGTGYHRAKMIDLAISHLNEWWLAGYGDRTIDWGWGTWSFEGHTDVTNEYLVVGLRYGLIGMFFLLMVLFIAFRNLIKAYKKSNDPNMKSLYWALGSILFSITVVWTSVSFFGQLMPLFYCVLGMIGSCTLFTLDIKCKKKKMLYVSRK